MNLPRDHYKSIVARASHEACKNNPLLRKFCSNGYYKSLELLTIVQLKKQLRFVLSACEPGEINSLFVNVVIPPTFEFLRMAKCELKRRKCEGLSSVRELVYRINNVISK